MYDYTSSGQVAVKRLTFTQINTAANGTASAPTGNTWDVSYTYDNEGYQTSVTYPTGQTHLIGLDFMKRPYSLTYQKPGVSVPGPIIESVLYNAADQVTRISWPVNSVSTTDPDAYSYPAFTETRTYNGFNQLTQIQTQVNGTPSGVDLNYGYSAGQNNGQVASVASGLDGQFNATYTYDALNRLKTMTGAKAQSYSYDGWGNLNGKSGDGLPFTVGSDEHTNRLVGGNICYDPNGNMLSSTDRFCNYYSYDVQNRLVTTGDDTSNGAVDPSGHQDKSLEAYYYTVDNKRVTTVRPSGNTQQVFYIYGAKNELAAVCTSQVLGNAPICDPRQPFNLTFAGRIIRHRFLPATVDRVGSVVANPVSVGGTPARQYYAPFGEQFNYVQSQQLFPGDFNFGTYFHDQTTGLDYADQRYYNSRFARFMTADPYRASAGPDNPGSWNRYAYVGNDPANSVDPSGLMQKMPDTRGPHPDGPTPPPPTRPDPPLSPRTDIQDKWYGLGGDCRKGLTDALPANQKTDPVVAMGSRLRALDRAVAASETIQGAVGDNIDWTWVAAIGIRETGFRNIGEVGGGNGLGYYQITNQPGVTQAMAGDLAWSSNWVAGTLLSNMGQIGNAGLGVSGDALAIATFASYNRGTAGVIGDLKARLGADAGQPVRTMDQIFWILQNVSKTRYFLCHWLPSRNAPSR